MSEEDIENITKLDRNFAPTLVHHHSLPDINFNRLSLITNIFMPKKFIYIYIYIYISYTLNPWLRFRQILYIK